MSFRLHILHLEDDVADAALVRDTLEMEGIACDVTRVETESTFFTSLQQGGFDLILADYTLPSFDGLSAFRIARQQRPDLPFVFVSGTLGEEVAVEALKIGATDYVLKTGLSRLAPAVHRALREAGIRAERNKAEEALRRSEGELRQVIETIPAMVWSSLPDGSNVLMNSRWTEYTGLSAAGLGWQAAVHPQDLSGHMDAFRTSSAAGLPFENEVRFRRADGEYRWFLVQGTPLWDEQGNILKWYGIVTDVEDRKRAEEARLEERVRERTRIARELHDTLLQSFQGLVFRFQAARYQLPDHPEEACDALDSALVSADQAMAEGRSAIQELRSGPFKDSNIEQMLLAMGSKLASSQNSGDSAPSLRVIVEGHRRAKRAMIREEVYRIARELLRNAYRHARARNIEAELRYDDDAFLLIVRDDGKGINPKVLQDHGRAGHWGLPGMYERAEGIGARLDISSEAGAGTEVRLTVPAAIAYEKAGDSGRFNLFRKTRIYEHRS
jgi:PAS domain S-box-containing protein